MLHRRTLSEYSLSQRREALRRGLNYDYRQFDRMDLELEHMSFSAPDTDILELDDRYILELALPGVVLDDVEVKVEDNYLTVVAKRTPNMFEERATYLRRELCHFLVREFEFEAEIMTDEIEARLERGILFISIPKIEAAVRIPVSAGSIEAHLSESSRGLKERTKITVK